MTAVEVKERPILFSGQMVKALLAANKSQTRRVCKLQYGANPGIWDEVEITYPDTAVFTAASSEWFGLRCPYGAPGDRLWVKETFVNSPDGIIYRATVSEHGISECDDFEKWKPSIHLPRWASRITLEITSVRVERLADLTEADAIAEGSVVEMVRNDLGVWVKSIDGKLYPNAVAAFHCAVWASIHAADGPHGWAASPWVFVISFRRV